MLNEHLVEKQGLDERRVIALEELHKQLEQLLSRPNIHFKDAQHCNDVIEGIEYALQLLWGFPLDSNYHRYWMEVDGCTCGKMDSLDALGTGRRYYNMSCPWHGSGGEDAE
jgi:hypothetical protein